jgi:iron(III) transport system substrate-binding protein
MTQRWRLVCLLAPVWLASCGDDRTPVVLYSPHGRDLLALFQETYEAQNPDVAVRWLDMGSQEVYDRVRSEAANPQGSVWFGGPATIFARGAEEGLLEPFRPSWAEAVAAESQHPEDLYFGLYRTPPLLVYNSDAVSPEEAPADWDDLLDPRWRGRVIIRDPLASGTMRTVFGMILARSVAETGDEEEGFRWLRRLDAQTREYVQNPALLHTKMVRQEGLVTIWELTDILFQQQRGAPLAYRFPTSGTPVIDDSVGVIRGTRNPQAARAFVEWVGSAEAQRLAAERLFRLPARLDLAPDELPEWAQGVMAEMIPAELDRELVAERAGEWMRRWDREVRGRGAP